MATRRLTNRESERPPSSQPLLALPLDEQRAFRGTHLGSDRAKVVHQAPALTLGDARDRGRRIAAVVKLEHERHLVEPGLGKRRRADGERPCCVGVVRDELVEVAQQRARLGLHSLVGLQKRAVVCEQIPAMAGFRVDEARHHAVDGIENLMRMLDFGGRRREARVLEHGEPAADQQHPMATRNGHRHLPEQACCLACRATQKSHAENRKTGEKRAIG